jgi:hypothetical protein
MVFTVYRQRRQRAMEGIVPEGTGRRSQSGISARPSFAGGRSELSDRGLQLPGATDQIRQKSFVDFHTALVFRQVSLVMGFEKNLHIGFIRTQSMNEGLENRNPVF